MDGETIYLFQSGPYWDWRVALDLFLGGAGVGALLFAIILDEKYKGKYRNICHTGAWLSPILIASGLILVMAKLGRPLHIFLTFTNFNPHAPLWWGGVFQPLLIVAAIIYAWRWRKSPDHDPVRTWLGRLIAPLAVIVGAYHGLLLGVLVARPLWATGPTVVAAMLGFASTGIAVVMIVHLIRMRIAGRLADQGHVAAFLDDLRPVRDGLFVVLVLQLGTVFLWWLSLGLGDLQDKQALAAANGVPGYWFMFWWLGIGLGLIIPLGLGGLVVIRGEEGNRGFQISMIGVTSILILVGGFFFRLALLYGGQIELPVNPGF